MATGTAEASYTCPGPEIRMPPACGPLPMAMASLDIHAVYSRRTGPTWRSRILLIYVANCKIQLPPSLFFCLKMVMDSALGALSIAGLKNKITQRK